MHRRIPISVYVIESSEDKDFLQRFSLTPKEMDERSQNIKKIFFVLPHVLELTASGSPSLFPYDL